MAGRQAEARRTSKTIADRLTDVLESYMSHDIVLCPAKPCHVDGAFCAPVHACAAGRYRCAGTRGALWPCVACIDKKGSQTSAQNVGKDPSDAHSCSQTAKEDLLWIIDITSF